MRSAVIMSIYVVEDSIVRMFTRKQILAMCWLDTCYPNEREVDRLNLFFAIIICQ